MASVRAAAPQPPTQEAPQAYAQLPAALPTSLVRLLLGFEDMA